ncbi:MAG: glycosyltransferase family 2 protein [Planctomycetaceae bacterium]|nr:glycosyltransferase family 2 protein [Planctomycetaceae bacterium]
MASASTSAPRITICIPHWEVPRYLKICLRSIRQHSRKYNLEVIVVDNGSQDGSLEYLRSLDWIRLISRPEETRDNWPQNCFTALDLGVQEGTGEYYVCMHTDVFVKSDNWLDPFLEQLEKNPRAAGAGAWKLELANPFYLWQKRVFGYLNYRIKRALGGRKRHITWKQGHYPRDYCAMYRRQTLLDCEATFNGKNGWVGGGCSIFKQLEAAGHEVAVFPVDVMARGIVHVAHGTAAVRTDRPLNHRRAQLQAERRVAQLFEQPWVRSLENNSALDAPVKQAKSAA